MSKRQPPIAGLVAGAAALLAALPAAARAEPAPVRGPPLASADCFMMRDWEGWSSPSRNTIYLQVRHRDVYRVDLYGGTSMLNSPGRFLISREHGTGRVCAPIDLHLDVADHQGFTQPLFPLTISKLTAEEVAALPREHRPTMARPKS